MIKRRLDKLEKAIQGGEKPKLWIVIENNENGKYASKEEAMKAVCEKYGVNSFEELQKRYNVQILFFVIECVDRDPETGEIVVVERPERVNVSSHISRQN